MFQHSALSSYALTCALLTDEIRLAKAPVGAAQISGPWPPASQAALARRLSSLRPPLRLCLGWRYLSKGTCLLLRPPSFYVIFVVSRVTMICYIINMF